MDAATAIAEEAMLGLRLAAGIGPPLAAHPLVTPALAWGRARGLVEQDTDRARLTQAGRLLADEIFVRLLPGPASAAEGLEGPAGRGAGLDGAEGRHAARVPVAITARPGASA